MAIFRRRTGVQLPVAVAVLAATLLVTPGSAHAAAFVSLGTADSFGVLAGSTVVSSGLTAVSGNLGVSPGTAVTGFPPGTVTGGTIHAGDVSAAQAQVDVATAYAMAAGQPADTVLSGQDLGGLTLTPGVYKFSASATLTGTLTFDAQGDPDAVFLIQVGSSLFAAGDSTVEVINGGFESNIFWQVGSSATLGADSAFAGTVLAFTTVVLNSGATLAGRALAINGVVALDGSDVTRPSAPTVPDAPTALTADPADQSANLTFVPPVDDGGSPVTSYEVSADGNDWTALTTVPGDGDALTATVTGLTNGTTYPLRVRAVNIAGGGAESSIVSVTPGIVAGRPIDVIATAGPSSIVVSWTAPVGETVTRYTATAGPGPATCTTTGELTCLLGGITGTGYTVTVVATVDGTDSGPSLPSDRVVPEAPLVADTAPDTALRLGTTHGDVSTVRRGQTVVVTGSGFLPYSTVAVTLYSSAALRIRVVARADGTISASIRIPRSLAGGRHAIVASGTDPVGARRLMKLSFSVPAAANGDTSLPVTGAPLTDVVLAGAGLLLGGALLYLASGLPGRRRYDDVATHRFAAHGGP